MSLGIGSATARTFMSLRRHYNYRLYFFGQVVSISGTWMQSVAQAWFVVQNTHSPLAVGILAVCQFGPYGLFGLFGGAVADRLDQRKVLMGTQAAFMVTAALLAGLTLTGHATVWEVYVLAGDHRVDHRARQPRSGRPSPSRWSGATSSPTPSR